MNKLLHRHFSRVLKTNKTQYPHTLQDKYYISPINSVPEHIPRPSYVGQKPQEHPSLSEKIKILNEDEIKGLRAASKIASQTLSHAV
jgi:hypothetical protein